MTDNYPKKTQIVYAHVWTGKTFLAFQHHYIPDNLNVIPVPSGNLRFHRLPKIFVTNIGYFAAISKEPSILVWNVCIFMQKATDYTVDIAHTSSMHEGNIIDLITDPDCSYYTYSHLQFTLPILQSSQFFNHIQSHFNAATCMVCARVRHSANAVVAVS